MITISRGGRDMAKLPDQFKSIRKRFEKYFRAVENLGKEARAAGPLNKKTAHLVQLAAAAASRSEGAVHSHTRRALDAGAKPAEIYHAIILLTSTVGFPTVSAALSWADDVLTEKKMK
jgi:AhpD family alkylhydroperoxidase